MGDDSVLKLKKNGFRFPNDPEAAIPQAAAPVYIDKRTLAAPREFLFKEHQGTKKKNLIKRENKDNLEKLLKDAELRGEGKEREDQVIDMEMLQEDGFDADEMVEEVPQKKNKKNQKDKMDVDMDLDENNINRTKRRRHKRSSKSHFIVNY
jgi:hypothetical protein